MDPYNLPSKIFKRSVMLGTAQKTSISLEDEFWSELRKIAHTRKMTIADLVSEINDARIAEGAGNLSSSIRLFVLKQVMERYHVQRNPALAIGNADADRHSGDTWTGG